MSIVLNHTIVRARDRHRAAAFLAQVLGLTVGGQAGPFVPVRINDELTLDFDDRPPFHAGHYAFLIDDATFDAVLARLRQDPTIDYGSGPEHGWDHRINHLGGGRGVYVRDPDGHSYELFTAVPVLFYGPEKQVPLSDIAEFGDVIAAEGIGNGPLGE